MNRDEFDKLSIMEQVEYLNKQLLEGLTLRKIAEGIGIDRSSIGKRVTKIGYEFNKELKQYIKVREVLESDLKATNYKSSNRVVIKEIQPSNEGIEDLKSKVDEMYSWYSSLKSHKELIINKFEGEPLNRSFKIYPSIQEDFKKFCETYKDTYKVQDIVSQAIYEFMEKYK